MFFYLGFRIDPVAMRDTIDAARKYVSPPPLSSSLLKTLTTPPPFSLLALPPLTPPPLPPTSYCELQIERSGDVILPPTEDPFDDDLGYGAAIHVVSTRPKHRITWGILRGIMQGLWGFLVMQEKYLVCTLFFPRKGVLRCTAVE